jgi:hypothetical protein
MFSKTACSTAGHAEKIGDITILLLENHQAITLLKKKKKMLNHVSIYFNQRLKYYHN